MTKKYFLSILFTIIGFQISGQLADFPMSPLQTDDVDNSGWQRVDDLLIHPFKNEISVTEGNEMWMTSRKGATLSSKSSLGEVKIKFHFMQSNSGAFDLILQNDYHITFTTSIEKGEAMMGEIKLPSGKVIKPSMNTQKAVGLWNSVEIIFKPSINKKAAILEKLTINGISVHSNVFLPIADHSETKLSITNRKGTSAIKGIEYLSFEEKRPLRLENIRYSVKEEADWDLNYDKSAEGVISGNVKEITHELPHDYQRYQTLYQADLVVDEDGYYAFTLDYAGRAKLFIEGEEIVGSENNAVRQPKIGTKRLTKGKYKLQYVYQKVWWPAQVGLYFSGSTFRPYPVHASRSLSVPRLAGGIYVNPEGSKAKIIRGFMMHKGAKRTEVVSVGDPSGVHYSLDLEKGSLLHIWKGDFADVTEMWHNRGEPQLLTPLGLATELSGTQVAYDAYMSDLVFDKYMLNAKGEPTFHFKLGDAILKKHIGPADTGLEVSMEIVSPSALSIVLGVGESIVDLGNGVYKIDDMYIKTESKNIQILEMDQKQLVYQGSKESKELNYKIVW